MDEIDSELYRQAEEVGCYGLVEGYAKNLHTHKQHFAETAVKADGPFYCPWCYSEVIVRKCVVKRDHFAHHGRLSPIGNRESKLHKDCKEEICELLKQRFPEGHWATEREIPPSKKAKTPKLVPDISGRIDGKAIVIEVQATSLSVPKIVARAENYSKLGISLLWIVPLIRPLGDEPFRPRMFERYLHSIYYGRTYYWTKGQGLTLTPVHYGKAYRYIEHKEWFENGEQQQAGGYNKPYKIVKSPEYGAEINMVDDFEKEEREEFVPKNERKTVPECNIWKDRLEHWWDRDAELAFETECEEDIPENYWLPSYER